MRAVNIVVPPDKSISQRAIMLASISEGNTRIKNLLMGDDCLRAIEAFRAMEVKIDILSKDEPMQGRIISADVIVHGRTMRGLKKPGKVLYLGNSGTTMRILPGILAGQNFSVVLKGDRSLSKRPMQRIVEPLRKMGSEILGTRDKIQGTGRGEDIYAPLKIRGGNLKAIEYKSKIASAQVKSCILLAGLFAKGFTSVTEPVKSRDHTERMLEMFGCRLKARGSRLETRGSMVGLEGPAELVSPGTIEIPGDISSAAFFIVAGSILPGMKIVIKKVGLNPTRTGILDILKRMGADIRAKSKEQRVKSKGQRAKSMEPYGDIIVKSSKLKGITISPAEVVRAIDEVPVIMVAACAAKGATVIKGISELRVKETDRIKSMVTNLRKVGADIEVKGEAIVINGARQLHGARVSSFGDHRTAMSMLIAGLVSKGKVTVTGLSCINKSFPGFQNLLCNLN